MAKNKLTPENKGIAASDLKRVVKDIIRHKKNASENSGLAGQSTKNAVEQYNLDKRALGLVVSLSKMDDVAKAMSTLRGVIEYADKLGMFGQVDAFDDLIPTMEAIIGRAKNQTAPENVGRDREESHATPPEEGIGTITH